jgi:hypothetical protein
MSIMNFKMSDTTIVDLPIQAIMASVVEEQEEKSA